MPNGFKECSVDGCNGNADWSAKGAKGFCRLHYDRFRRHGDPFGGKSTSKKGDPMRFLLEVAANYEGKDCLIWPFCKGSDGYGKIKIDGKMRMANRVLCERVYGAPPTPKHEAAHSCGKGHLSCITKGHLSWKTAAENAADKLIHGTSPRGANSPRAKLSEAKAREILALKGKETKAFIANKFGISPTTVWRIHKGSGWPSIQPAERTFP